VTFETIGVVPSQPDTPTAVKPSQRAERPPQSPRIGKETGLGYNAKAEGAENRREYLRQLRQQGIVLEHERRTAYLTPRGNRVVLPLANKPWNPGKWFLGAPKEFFDKPNTVLILICKEADKFLDFLFPPKDMQKLLPMLTEVRGELRFNVRRDEGVYYLYRPAVDKMDITRFLHHYEPLKGL
jgi:hypothetical protein